MSEASPLLVHGFARRDILASLHGILETHAIGLVTSQPRHGIVALASAMDRDDHDRAFDNTELLTGLALAHAAVLAAVAAEHDVVPLRLGTVVSGSRALADLCEAQAVMMGRVLDVIGGCVEIGVRVVTRCDSRAIDHGRPSDPPRERPSDGRSYLRARALDRGGKARASEQARALCSSVLDVLQTLAPVIATTTETAGLVNGRLLDVACLVERGGIKTVRACLDAPSMDAEKLGLGIETTGPWPAYSFVVQPSAGANRQ